MGGFIDPDDVQVKVGLLCSDGALTIICATKQFVHTFNISWSGFFAIYVENLGDEAITIDIFAN